MDHQQTKNIADTLHMVADTLDPMWGKNVAIQVHTDQSYARIDVTIKLEEK